MKCQQNLFIFYLKFFKKTIKMSLKMNWKTPLNKCKQILAHPSLTTEFQISTLKLLFYNYVIVLLIANQDVGWNYTFKDTELANRFGYELIEPLVLSKFAFCFRLLTIIMNTLAVACLMEPNRKYSIYLMPCILWNFYTITAVAENIFEIVWTMFQLEVAFHQLATVFIVGIFMLAFQGKLTIQVIRFYEYLNYIHM